jgi:hypothetical protein
MAKVLTTALRLMRLLMACWQHPLLTMDDIQRICRDEGEDNEISQETAYNYIASLQALGLSVKKLSRKTWYVERLPEFPGLTGPAATYRQIGEGHPVLDRLMGSNQQEDAVTTAWQTWIDQRRVCNWQAFGGLMVQGVPLLLDGPLLRYWHLGYELPLHIPLRQITEVLPQPDTMGHLLMPRVIVQFEVLGVLAQRFEPTPHDTVLEQCQDYLRVANRCLDATALSRRLLRYQLQCRVLGPPRFKQLMLDELAWLQHAALPTVRH